MKSLFERVNELEEKVFFLERELSMLKQKELSVEQNAQVESYVSNIAQMPEQEKPYDMKTDEFSNSGGFNYVGEFLQNERSEAPQHMSQYAMSQYGMSEDEADFDAEDDIKSQPNLNQSFKQEDSRSKYDETLIGKYIAGALASLLIFIGAASFAAIIWNQISDFMKFAILSISGFLICAAGYYMFLKSPFEKRMNSSIAAVVFSTGAGLVYISILSSGIVLKLFSPFTSSVMCLLWTLALMFSYRFTDRFICIAIAYIGAFINLVLSAYFITVFSDVLFLFFFITSVNLSMLYVTQKKKGPEFQVCIFLAGFLYVGYLYVSRYKQIEDAALEISALTCLLGLKNLFFYFNNRELEQNNTQGNYFVLRTNAVILELVFAVGFFMSIFLCGWPNYLKDYQTALVLLAVFGGQFFINACFNKHTNLVLNSFYGLAVYFAMLGLTGDLIKAYSGGIILILFIVSKRIWNNDYSLLFLFFILITDSIVLLFQSDLILILFSVINLILFIYFSKEKKMEGVKTAATLLGLILLYLNAHIIAKAMTSHLPYYTDGSEYKVAIAHVLCVIFFILFLKLNMISYKKSSENSDFEVSEYEIKYSNLLFYFFSFILYVEGLMRLQLVDAVGVKFVFSLSTLTLMLIQSYFMVGQNRKLSDIQGGWLVIKYLLFTWAVMRSFLQLPVESLAYSVVGLVIAVISIYIGFHISVKSIRQFGLAITILMVTKYIFVDLSGKNSITRVIAFVIGGLLCFVVSVIYNRLSVTKRGSDEED